MPTYTTIPDCIIDEIQVLPNSENIIKWLVRNCPHRISQESYEKLIYDEKVLTDYDTPEILQRRKVLQDVKAFPKVPQAVIQEIADKHLKYAEHIPAEKKMIIVIGIPSSGKTTYIENNKLEEQYFIGDQDLYRQELFDYYNKNADRNDPENIVKESRFHGSAQAVFQENILPDLLDIGTNIVVPTSGIFEYVERLAKAAKREGYNVTVVNIDEDVDETIKRCLRRIKSENRLFDPLFNLRRAFEAKKIADLSKKSSLIDDVIVVIPS